MSTASERAPYTISEKAADAAIHVIGFVSASVALGFLLGGLGPEATTAQVIALIVYAIGLLGMLAFSALYNLTPPGSATPLLRKLDQAMIFVMIAGSYTPFAVSAFPPSVGMPLCLVIWTFAAFGVAICVAWRRLYDRIYIALYLVMGWLVLPVLPPLAATVPVSVVALLFAGGIVYSMGVFIYTRTRLSFQDAAWHGMVVVAAALHLAAVAQVLP